MQQNFKWKETTRNRPRISDEQWANARSLIEELNAQEVRRSDICRALAPFFGFEPSVQQLRDQMKRWGIPIFGSHRSHVPNTSMEDRTETEMSHMTLSGPSGTAVLLEHDQQSTGLTGTLSSHEGLDLSPSMTMASSTPDNGYHETTPDKSTEYRVQLPELTHPSYKPLRGYLGSLNLRYAPHLPFMRFVHLCVLDRRFDGIVDASSYRILPPTFTFITNIYRALGADNMAFEIIYSQCTEPLDTDQRIYHAFECCRTAATPTQKLLARGNVLRLTKLLPALTEAQFQFWQNHIYGNDFGPVGPNDGNFWPKFHKAELSHPGSFGSPYDTDSAIDQSNKPVIVKYSLFVRLEIGEVFSKSCAMIRGAIGALSKLIVKAWLSIQSDFEIDSGLRARKVAMVIKAFLLPWWLLLFKHDLEVGYITTCNWSAGPPQKQLASRCPWAAVTVVGDALARLTANVLALCDFVDIAVTSPSNQSEQRREILEQALQHSLSEGGWLDGRRWETAVDEDQMMTEYAELVTNSVSERQRFLNPRDPIWNFILAAFQTAREFESSGSKNDIVSLGRGKPLTVDDLPEVCETGNIMAMGTQPEEVQTRNHLIASDQYLSRRPASCLSEHLSFRSFQAVAERILLRKGSKTSLRSQLSGLSSIFSRDSNRFSYISHNPPDSEADPQDRMEID